jgi:PAS domain S-box-containing protein/putative nucleotidyltransferase with HDIG domain
VVRVSPPRILLEARSPGRSVLTAVVLLYGLVAAANGYAAATTNHELAGLLLSSSSVPVVATSYLYRLRGGLLAAAASVAMALGVYEAAHLYPPLVLITNATLVALLASVVGWTTQTVASQTRILARRDELSLELLATLGSGSFVTANAMWGEILGYSYAELHGRRFLSLVHPDDQEAARAASLRVADCYPITSQPLRLRHADGRYLWIEWSARIDPDDRLTYLAGRDVTARTEAKETVAEQRALLEATVSERTAELERRTRELDLARRENLRRLAIAAEFRDDDTAAHTERVGALSALIAAQLGLLDTEITLLREAATLHDIGKIGTPDAILLKPGRLTSAERREMERHTELGAEILRGSNAPVLQLATLIALHHHERWDGTGYPQQLVGKAIPVEARIVALADTFDALTQHRPYKSAWTIDRALAEIQRLAGRQFDPAVAAAFGRIPVAMLEAIVQHREREPGSRPSRRRRPAEGETRRQAITTSLR